MAKESNSGLGVNQRYGPLGNTTEWRVNKTEGSLNQLVIDVTPDLNGESRVITLPKNAVVLAAYYVDKSDAAPLTGTGLLTITRAGKTADTITVTGDTSATGTLTNSVGGPADPAVDDTITATLSVQDIAGGQASVVLQYFNQRNVG